MANSKGSLASTRAAVKLTKDSPDRFLCPRCGKLLVVSGFYASSSPLWKHTGFLPICVDCTNQLFIEIYRYQNNIDENFEINMYTLDLEKIKYVYDRMCYMFDLAYSTRAYELTKQRISQAIDKAATTDGTTEYTKFFGIYLQALNSLYMAKPELNVYKNGDRLSEPKYINNILEDDEEASQMTEEEKAEMMLALEDKWGAGLPEESYKFLERRFQAYCDSTPPELESDVVSFTNIALTELDLREARLRKNKNDVMSLTKQLQDLMKSAGIRSTDIKSANADKMAECYGNWIRDIEKTEPAEYFKDKKLYSDFDGIMKYLNDFIFRPMKNLLLGSRDFNIGGEPDGKAI